MNVKLAVALVACLFLVEVCFASDPDNNNRDNSRLFDDDDKSWKNYRVVTTFGCRGAKLRVHSLYNPYKWVQITHVSVSELDSKGNPVYLKNSKGKLTNQLRAVQLANTNFQWSTPTVVSGPQGRTVDAFFRTAFQVLGATGITTQVTFHVNVIQQNSTQVVNGFTLRREQDDVQFSLDIVDWPFESPTNQLDWQFYVKTNYPPGTVALDGSLVHAKAIKGMPGTNWFVFQNAVLSYPDSVEVDGTMEPCSHKLSNVDTRGDFLLDIVMPRAAHHLFYNAIIKVINLPSGGDPNPCGSDTCPPACQTTVPPSCGDGGSGTGGSVDVCTPNPCQNNGVCAANSGVPTCTCVGSWSGPTCASSACSTNPCQNGGSCTAASTGAASCTCTAAFTGTTCGTAVSACASGALVCANGGTCATDHCVCPVGWTGTTCTTVVPPCSSGQLVCNNGGTCATDHCVCTIDWSDATCSTPVSKCVTGELVCNNGGTCVTDVNHVGSCNCPAGWADATCSTNPCSSTLNPCQNGGVCTQAALNSLSTNCGCPTSPVTYTGPTCAVTAYNDILGTPVDAAPIDQGYNIGTTHDGTAFGRFTAGNTICIFFGMSGGMRLYDANYYDPNTNQPGTDPATGLTSVINMADPTAVQNFIDNADYIQLSVGNLVELDSTQTPIPSTSVSLAGGSWVFDNTNTDPNYELFLYTVSPGTNAQPPIVHFQLTVKYYLNPTAETVSLAAGTETVALTPGALKFSTAVSPWPFSDSGAGNNFLQWTVSLQSRFSDAGGSARAVAAGQVQRFQMTTGDYTPLENTAFLDGTQIPAVITSNFDVNNGVNYINHVFNEYLNTLQFDPILALPDPNDPGYPPWVQPNTPGGASVIRDPRSQFQGAATLHTSAIAVALATVAAFVAARV